MDTSLRARRLRILGILVAGAAALIVGLVVFTGGGKTGPDAPAVLAAEPVAAPTTLTGIPQSGTTLGNPKAPITIKEFADLQCPYCRDFSVQTLPRVVQDYVRTGKLKIELHLLTFLGPDSIRGAQVAERAGAQNCLWNFVDLFYANQGEEKTGYATDAFLRQLTTAVPGLDRAAVFSEPVTDTPTPQNADADALAQRYGVTGTPTLLVGRSGGTTFLPVEGLRFDGSRTDFDAVRAAIDDADKVA